MTAAELIGGYYASGDHPLADAYAHAAWVLGANAVHKSSRGSLRRFTLRADLRGDAAAADGRPVHSYPGPASGTPVWLAPRLSAAGGLARGIDFSVGDDGEVLFDVDVLADHPDLYAVWEAGSPVAAGGLWYATATPTPAAADPEQGTWEALTAACAAAYDSPRTLHAAETVEELWEGPDGAWRVVTDKAAYRLPAADTPAVAAGDVLAAGSPLGTAWELVRLGPAKPDLAHFTTPAWFHLGVTAGGITFYDEEVPLVVDTSASRTRVRWRMGAQTQDDLDDYWDASHTTGTAAGTTSLAQAMDLRGEGQSTDPGAESLPAVVNPLEFVCRELFAGNAYLLLVRPDRFGPSALAADERVAAVRAAAGPYTAVFEYEDEVPAYARKDPS